MGHVAAEHEPDGTPRRLPVWPIAALLLGTPVWWLAGTSLFMWPLLAGVMAVLLLLGGPLRAPAAFGLWLAFLAWMLVSGLMLVGDPQAGIAKYAGNAVLYLSATVLFLYAYRVSRDPLARRRLVLVGAGFWAIVVAGGWFALAVPDFSLTTPLQRLLPSLDDANVFIARRITADAAVEGWIGARPRAPFGEVNEWGVNFALALPFALAALSVIRSRVARIALLALIASSIVPLVESQNRGAWIALGFAAVYALVRYGRPRLRRLSAPRLAVGALAAAAAIAAVAVSPTGETIADRVSSRGGGDSNRVASYRAALSLTADSPLLGHATTQELTTSPLPAGTHGHGFRLLVSHGVPSLILFAGWFGWVAWRTRRGPPIAACCHLVVLIGLVGLAFYNLLPAQLHLMMLAAGIGLPAVAAALPAKARAEPAAGT